MPVVPGWATFTEALPRVRGQVADWPDREVREGGSVVWRFALVRPRG